MYQTASRYTLIEALQAAGVGGWIPLPKVPQLPEQVAVSFPESQVAVFALPCQAHRCPYHYKFNFNKQDEMAHTRRKRHQRSIEQLQRLGYRALTWWEHEPLPRFMQRLGASLQARQAAPARAETRAS